MKIAVTSTGPTLDDTVETRFGRCAYFLIIDTDTMQCEPIENPNIALGGGAGIQSAQLMSEKGVKTVLTGNCGPNAFNVFGEAGIQVIVGVSGSVRNAVEQFKTGVFSSATGPNVTSHFGMNSTPADPTTTGQSVTGPLGQGGRMGLGRGGGQGMGRGVQCGRGMGKGMGRSGGMGRCMDKGRGMGMKAGWGMGNRLPIEQPASLSESVSDPAQILAYPQGQVQMLEQQNHQVEQRIRELKTGRKLIAIVLSERCAGCGICTDVCPENAINIKEHAVVNWDICTGCGKCVSECPNEAVVLTQSNNS